MVEVIGSSKPLLLTRVARRNIPLDNIFHSHRRKNLKSYIILTGWSVKWRHNVSPVRYELGFISQKTEFFVGIAVKTSNLTPLSLYRFLAYSLHFSGLEMVEVCSSKTSANFYTIKNRVFWDVTPCGSCKKRCFGGTYRLLHTTWYF
jgi:hypothetical protein